MKKKWTFIDTLIILIVAAAAVFGTTKLLPSMAGGEKKKVELTVLIQNKDQELADAIAPGVKATLSLTEKDGGIVKEVNADDAQQMTFDSINGEYGNEIVPGKKDIRVTIEADCVVTDKAIKTGDTAIKVGAEIPVRGRGFAAEGFVIDIKD